MNKSYVLLRIYDELRAGNAIRLEQCREEFGISVSTFRRYIACLRNYLAEQYCEEIVYRSEYSGYILVHKK